MKKGIDIEKIILENDYMTMIKIMSSYNMYLNKINENKDFKINYNIDSQINIINNTHYSYVDCEFFNIYSLLVEMNIKKCFDNLNKSIFNVLTYKDRIKLNLINKKVKIDDVKFEKDIFELKKLLCDSIAKFGEQKNLSDKELNEENKQFFYVLKKYVDYANNYRILLLNNENECYEGVIMQKYSKTKDFDDIYSLYQN